MFQPGNNFGKGRPKGTGKNQVLADWCEEKGIARLIQIAEGQGHELRLINGRTVEVGPKRELQFEALKLALAYGLGKPTEQVEITKPTWDPEQSKLHADEVWALIKELENDANGSEERTSRQASVGDRPA